ncbi:MAG TPA: carboxypeptidase regulatory-like domain-containing protein, partial [Chondromyces sp.]|nr:carboxypeptidase regulatory-like domain-containing protein [Chondromyces sp.]
MRNRRFAFVVVLVLGLALQALPAAAQGKTTGSIRGLVTDQQGGVLPGVTVIAISDALIGGRQATITTAEGSYRFPSLPPGMYEIEARLDGFQPVLQQNVQLGLGRNINVDLVLGDITISDEIVVVAESSQVSVVSNAADFNMAESFIERQPTFRDPNSLMNYAPGIQGSDAFGAPSANQNAYNMDGVDVSDPDIGTRWILPSMDWIQEVQVGGLGADAEYGGFTGAVVNMITKSGGNDFHGDIRAFYSGGSLNSD